MAIKAVACYEESTNGQNHNYICVETHSKPGGRYRTTHKRVTGTGTHAKDKVKKAYPENTKIDFLRLQ